jgi:hypothetical protein
MNDTFSEADLAIFRVSHLLCDEARNVLRARFKEPGIRYAIDYPPANQKEEELEDEDDQNTMI